jgi:ornithine carbamoyltransferase
LGRLYDAIEYRGFEQNTVQELARWSGVPVYNGLTNQFHPTQILADYLTMQEHCAKPLNKMRLAYLGDARYNIGDSLLQGAALMGLDFRIAAPRALWPPQALIDASQNKARSSGAQLMFTESPQEAVQGVDFIYTDVWVSMGEPDAVWAERITQLRPYQVNSDLMKLSGNPEVKFLHCLPALHDRQTRKGEEIFKKFGMDGLEVTDAVFESKASLVWDQAENRLHTIKALLVATLA